MTDRLTDGVTDGVTDGAARAGSALRSATPGRPGETDWLDVAARVGLVAFGVVHIVMGVLAVQLAFGESDSGASSTGALKELSEQPFGAVLVWAIAIGMVLLTLWQGTEAAVGHRDEEGKDRLRKRATSAGRAVVYAVIAFSGVQVALGESSGGGTDSMTAQLMDAPGGQLLVGLVALGIGVVGGYFCYEGVTDRFMKKLSTTGADRAGQAYRWFGRVGYVAKGAALLAVAALFGYAAITHEAKKSGGLDQALTTLRDQPFGPYLLTAVGIGIVGFGLFCFAWARHLDR